MKQTTRQWWVGIAAIALSCAAVSFARANTSGRAVESTLAHFMFVQANQEFSEGHFQEAIKSYESLVSSGQWSANLFYDLGNSWFRMGDFGQAILNYERALALDPHHPEAAANLALVRDQARALELKRNSLERYIEAGTPTQYSIAASVALWSTILLTAHLLFSRRRSAALVALTIFSIALFAGAVFALYSLETGSKGKTLAIVTGKEIVARLATADNASSVLALPPGSEIKILSQRGDWLYAALPNDLRGWIPASGAQRVRM